MDHVLHLHVIRSNTLLILHVFVELAEHRNLLNYLHFVKMPEFFS